MSTNRMVFVEKEPEDYEHVKLEDVGNRKIITCCQCDKPAVKIDIYYPYFTSQNLCSDHQYIKSMDK